MSQVADACTPQHELASPPVNRLSIGHLLLWTAMTALVFSISERPPAPSQIGFVSFLSQSGANVEAAMERERQRQSRILQRRYLMNLMFAPVYGLALAGLVLAAWRMVTARRDFPIQAGHWLLVTIGSVTGFVVAHIKTPLPEPASGVQDSLFMLVVAALSLLAWNNVGHSFWQVPLFIFAGSMLLAFPLPALPVGPGGALLFGISSAGIFMAFFLGLVCATIEVVKRKQGDLFHWIGIATLIGVVGHLAGWIFVSWF